MDLHRKMEFLMPYPRNHFTNLNYRHFLTRLLGFYVPIEDHIADFLSHRRDPFDMPQRYKVPLLISDLRSVGVRLTEIHQTPVCTSIKEINNDSDLVGTLYALEHLTLNSVEMKRHLQDDLQLGDEQLKYCGGYGDQTYLMWMLFRATAENLILPDEKEATVTRARHTFIKLKNWIKAGQVQA